MVNKSRVRIWKRLKIEHKRRVLLGSYAYTAEDQIVEVRSVKGEHRARHLVAGSTPETLSRLMLIELADEGKA
jgi:hypothetical protein